MSATNLLVYVFVSPATVNEAPVTVKSYRPDDVPTTSVRLHEDLIIQHSGDPAVMADLFDHLASRVRAQHALWRAERDDAPAADPDPEGTPT